VISDEVIIYVTAYGNEDLFRHCVESCLNQTHTQIVVNVFDDGPANGLVGVRDLLRGYSDTRLKYFENPVRFGHMRNDAQLLRRINPDAWAVVLSTDMCLAPHMVEALISKARENGARVVRSSGDSHEYKNLTNGFPYQFDKPFRSHHGPSRFGLLESLPMIAEYFGPENKTGELAKFSFYGSLFHGALARNFDGAYKRFVYHGFDQYLAMMLLLLSRTAFFVEEPLIHDVVGAPRLGPPRPTDGASRADCLFAAEEFLTRYELELHSLGLDVSSLRSGQVHKANFYLDNFTALLPQVRLLRDKNLDFLGSDVRPFM